MILRIKTLSIMKLRIMIFNPMSKITLGTKKFIIVRLGVITKTIMTLSVAL